MLGEDYSQAPTCATCHMSGHSRNGGKVTHDPGERISWTNRPPVSLWMDTDVNGKIVTETDPAEAAAPDRRHRGGQAQPHEGGLLPLPHADLRQRLLQQYDDFVVLYNEKFAKPGQALMARSASTT